jgi:16S rRNA (guanine527-N7)-methyltransferase
MVRQLDLSDKCIVLSKDIAHVNVKYDIITARAVSNINEFLDLTFHTLSSNGQYLLMKGGRYEEEIDIASKNWIFDTQLHQSITDDNAKLIVLSNVKKR